MIIATRLLKVQGEAGESSVPVSLLAPEPSPGGGWSCAYSIGWPDGERRAQGWGVDAVQALYLTLERIGLDLYTSRYHQAGTLVWERPGDGYGFPVPPNVRRESIGSDRYLSGRGDGA